jgi:acyl-CoA reductase-like NAD-dependent aldehyde dehydrogenase
MDTSAQRQASVIDRKMLIGGHLVASESNRWLNSIDPATEEVIGRIPNSSKADVDAAVKAAQQAFPAWAALDMDERAAYLHKLANAIKERGEEIARLEAQDTGHTIKRVRGDVGEASWILGFYAGLGRELKGETIPSTPNSYHFTIRQPYGVVGRIVPFNHPIMFCSRIGAPLIAGNTVVLKPPKEVSLSPSIFAEICQQVMPPGVVNVVTGSGAEAGEALARHPKVKRIGFIGSQATGQQLAKSAAEVTVKHITLELGGKNPMIVFPDADLKKALPSVLRGMSFAWSGQSCGSLTRLFLHDSIYDASVAELSRIVNVLKVGDPLDDSTDMGPIVHKAQYEKVLYYIEAGKQDGARLVAGGTKPEGARFARGYWIRPTIFADVTPKMRIFNEEIFGPVLSVIRWKDTEEVIAMANAVDYGLTASVWTENLRSALNTVRRIESGYCWINGVASHYKAVPFGGVKCSGVGREECLDEILSYTECKTINVVMD